MFYNVSDELPSKISNYMGHHIIKWAKLNLSHAIMTLMSLDVRVIIACDKIQLGPFHYVAIHMILYAYNTAKHSNSRRMQQE